MNSSGYSLIELMVTMAVMAILATIVIFQTQRVTPEKAVDKNRTIVTSALTLIRTYNTTGHVCCGSIIPGGITPAYGMRVELSGAPNTAYSVYADVDVDHQYSAGDEIIEQGVLTQNVEVASCAVGPTTTYSSSTPPPGNYCDVLFTSGSSGKNLYVNGIESAGDNVVYTLQSTEDSTVQQSITLYYGSYVIETL